MVLCLVILVASKCAKQRSQVRHEKVQGRRHNTRGKGQRTEGFAIYLGVYRPPRAERRTPKLLNFEAGKPRVNPFKSHSSKGHPGWKGQVGWRSKELNQQMGMMEAGGPCKAGEEAPEV